MRIAFKAAMYVMFDQHQSNRNFFLIIDCDEVNNLTERTIADLLVFSFFVRRLFSDLMESVFSNLPRSLETITDTSFRTAVRFM